MELYKSFDKISYDYSQIIKAFKLDNNFLAHNKPGKSPETLEDHVFKVIEYLLTIIRVHDLEGIIDGIIKNISLKNDEIGGYIKNLFFNSIVFHDFGKVNNNFQLEKLNNTFFEFNNSVKIGTTHSFLSAYIFINYFSIDIYNRDFSNGDKNILWCFAFLFGIPILKHHSSFITKEYDYENEKIQSIKHFLRIFNIDPNGDISDKLIEFEKIPKPAQNLWTFFDKVTREKKFDFFALYALLKLNYSLLTASDYYATSEYMNNLKYEIADDLGIMTEKFKKKIIHNIANNKNKSFNRKLIENINYYNSFPSSDLQDISFNNLNILRQKIGAEMIKGIEQHNKERVFYIEAPTGAGKTNLSLIAIIRMIELFPELNKVFYVFPYTTLITQTFKVIKDTFKLTNQDVTQLHYKAGYQHKHKYSDEIARYGNELRNEIDNLFVNYPISLLSHIKFFDILKSNEKNTTYLLHRLANSIVIIDELQAYDPRHWDKIKYFISNYARLFNIRFLIMSATLPEIGSIAIPESESIKFHHLIPNAGEKYLKNPNFNQRVSIKSDLLEEEGFNMDRLASFSYEKSEFFASSRSDGLQGSVYTIIEFIYKKIATEFFNFINNANLFSEYKIFLLSGTILEPKRKEIINYLKDETNRNKKVLLITTQVVEAGVDIDMDLGFKNQSLPDSDEQLAGRINRNVKKKNCELYLFRINEPKTIYGKDLRYKVTKGLRNDELETILQEKDFKHLYNRVIEKINKEDIKKAGKEDYMEYIDKVNKLNFQDIHKCFKLIDNDSASVFVPVDINVVNYRFPKGDMDFNFSPEELNFIKEYQCFVNSNENEVSGEKTWNLYISLINNKDIDFTKKKIELKILNGIMSNFVFSIYTNKISELREYFEYNEDHQDFQFIQYYKLNKEYVGKGKLYDYAGGLNEEFAMQDFEIF